MLDGWMAKIIKMKNLLENSNDLFAKALATMKVKNADYSGDSNSMRNFELTAEIAGVKMSQGILTRLMDKMSRIGNLIKQDAKVTDESIFDTIQDGVNYLAILYYALLIESQNN